MSFNSHPWFFAVGNKRWAAYTPAESKKIEPAFQEREEGRERGKKRKIKRREREEKEKENDELSLLNSF